MQTQTTNPITVSAPMPDSFAFDAGATYDQPLPQGFTSNKLVNTAFALGGVRLATQAMSAQLWSGNTETNLTIELQFHTESDPIADVRTPIVNLLKLTMPTTSATTGLLNSPGPSFDFSNNAVSGVKQSGSILASDFTAVVGGTGSALSNIYNQIAGGKSSIASMIDTNKTTNDGGGNAVPTQLNQNNSLGTAAFWNSKLKNKISIQIGNYMFFDSVVITRVALTAVSNFDAQTGLPHMARVVVEFKPLFMLTQNDLDSLFINPGGNSSTPSTNYSFSMPSGQGVGNSFGVNTSNTFGFNGG